MLMHMMEEFMDDVLYESSKLARHRESQTLEASDLLLYLERHHDISAPGYDSLESKAVSKKPATTGTTGTGSSATTNNTQSSSIDEHNKRLFQVQRAAAAVAQHTTGSRR